MFDAATVRWPLRCARELLLRPLQGAMNSIKFFACSIYATSLPSPSASTPYSPVQRAPTTSLVSGAHQWQQRRQVDAQGGRATVPLGRNCVSTGLTKRCSCAALTQNKQLGHRTADPGACDFWTPLRNVLASMAVGAFRATATVLGGLLFVLGFVRRVQAEGRSVGARRARDLRRAEAR